MLCKCDECMALFPGGRTLSRRQTGRHDVRLQHDFEAEAARDPVLAATVQASLADSGGHACSGHDFDIDDDDVKMIQVALGFFGLSIMW